ncbi:MAG TPA: UDP-glucose--hexose-1-phosphate uridylyltransferase [Candidatus Acidoferrum sp.]|nr:UDP-glucose--hexose-1-phosphate uridylyltransferase [Candidatus Acidoferrum sp.]
MNLEKLLSTPHKRFNPLLREWVLVSPQRTERPWQGKVEQLPAPPSVAYDPSCYLCPGNKRAGGKQTPKYSGTYAFDNDFPALLPEVEPFRYEEDGLLVAQSDRGICRVLCFSPRHDLTIPRMNAHELRGVIDAWIEQFSSLAQIPWVRNVQIFENRGELMGASNPHPHCQIWANATLPNLPARENESFRVYHAEKHSCLLCDYLHLELQRSERIVCQNNAFAVVVPFWAVWPFETLVLSKRHVASLEQLNEEERALLGDILRRITIRYDNLFETAFPYSMGFHQRPTDGQPHEAWHLHAHYFPPLLRSATVRKFMVGYELLASPQRDLTPESAAARLREMSETHYLDRPTT